MNSIWNIARKDLLLLLKDRRALVLLLVLPLLFISIVGMSTGQFLTRDDESRRFQILVVDKSHSDLSNDLLANLKRHHELDVKVAESESESRDKVMRGDASTLLIIGPEFESRADDLRMTDIMSPDSGPLASGASALDLHVESRPVATGLGELVEGLVFSQAIKVTAPVVARKNPVTRQWISEQAQAADNNAKGSAADAKTPDQASSFIDVYTWVVPGFTVMFAFFVISIMARSFIAERENGTLRRLLLAPALQVQVLIGKTVPFYLTSLLQCSLLFLCGRLLFGMSWGPEPAYLIPVILCTSLAATSLGLLLATMVRTDQQVSSYCTALILILSSLSGCFFPREMFPQLMKQISLFTPHGWALRAFDSVLSHPTVSPDAVATCCGMLTLFAAICFAIGCWRFRLVH